MDPEQNSYKDKFRIIMKLYRTKKGIIIEVEDNYYLEENVSWDSFFNDDNLIHKIKDIQTTRRPVPDERLFL